MTRKMSDLKSFPKSSYTLGWICTRSIELAAAIEMLDERHEDLEDQDPLDHNNYVLGKIHKHHIVIACLPAGQIGSTPAATVAKDMFRTFSQSMRLCLLVGVGGGIPRPENDIRLGDVVVSVAGSKSSAVTQFDMGRIEKYDEFVSTGALNNPPSILLSAVSQLQAYHLREDPRFLEYVTRVISRTGRTKRTFSSPGLTQDLLFQPDYDHPTGSNCSSCDRSKLLSRAVRDDSSPTIHYGTIASGNSAIEHGETRDILAERYEALCFETEATGLMKDFSCVVIRGISNYADSHRSENWSGYAAATAAATAKELLQFVTPQKVLQEKLLGIVCPELRDIARTLEEINANVVQGLSNDQSREDIECLVALHTSDYERFKNINPPRVHGTCQWVFTHEKYVSWYQNEHDDVLWISADPGCGKSVLARSLVDNDLKQTNATICHFFFKDNDQQNKLPVAICALIHQLLSQQKQLIRHLPEDWRKAEKKDLHIMNDASNLWSILLKASRDPTTGNVICVIDAADECNRDGQKLLAELVREFRRSLTKTTNSKLKFIITSRPYQNIQDGLLETKEDIWIPGEDKNVQISQEINLVLEVEIAKLAARKNLPPEVQDALWEKLKQIPNRTYLWLHLILDDLRERNIKMTSAAYIESLQTLPMTVEQAYEKILNKSDSSRTTELLLRIIIGAERPLTIMELQIALEIALIEKLRTLKQLELEDESRFKMRLRNTCGLFVFVLDSRVYLLHQTAKEFLVRGLGQTNLLMQRLKWKWSITENDSQLLMARICMEYIIADDFNVFEEVYRPSPGFGFLFFSATNWPIHYEKIQGQQETLRELAFQLHSKTSYRELWVKLFSSHHPDMEEELLILGSLHSASYAGHEDVVRMILEKKWHSKIISKFHRASRKSHAILAAAGRGYVGITKLLLDKGANIKTEDRFGYTLLARAAFGGHEAVVRLLLDKGAKIEAKDEFGNTPLAQAVDRGHEAVVRLLLDKGANIESDGHFGNTPLAQAADRGHEAVVRLLLDKGANIESDGHFGNTPLALAADRGHEAVVRLLLDKGANIDAKNEDGCTPVALAADGGHEAVVQLLLEKGANIEANGYGETPMSQAASEGHEAVVQLLLEKGANIEAMNISGNTPLGRAAWRGHEAVVQLLVEKGANVEAKNKNRDTPLAQAASEGHEAVVQLLLNHGANPESKNEFGLSPIWQAAVNRHHRVIHTLLQHGVEVEEPSWDPYIMYWKKTAFTEHMIERVWTAAKTLAEVKEGCS